MCMFTQWVPQEWADEDGHDADLEAYADRLIERVNDVAPNFKGAIRTVRSSARSRCRTNGA